MGAKKEKKRGKSEKEDLVGTMTSRSISPTDKASHSVPSGELPRWRALFVSSEVARGKYLLSQSRNPPV